MKLLKAVILLFVFSSPIYSQEAYNIDDFGIYIIDNNGIQRVPGDYTSIYREPSFWFFKDQFAIFAMPRGIADYFFIYDMENKMVSEPLAYGPAEQWPPPIIQKNGGEVTLVLGNIAYTLDSDTLAVKESYGIEGDNNAKSPALEYGFYEIAEISPNTIRYFFGGEYRKYKTADVIFHPDLKDIHAQIDQKKAVPFTNDYLYIDVHFADDIWDWITQTFEEYYPSLDYSRYHSFKVELGGDRAVLIVYKYVFQGK
jgi:hypothetical protein